MLCKRHWIVLYTVHVTAFCLGGVFSRSWRINYTIAGICKFGYNINKRCTSPLHHGASNATEHKFISIYVHNKSMIKTFSQTNRHH